MSDTLSGAFLCSGFTARRSDLKTAFVKPVNIRVYSAPAPVRMRVVTYDMQFLAKDELVSEAVTWKSKSTTYQSPFSGKNTFSFTVGTSELDLNDLLTNIRRHFYEVVLKGRDCRTRTEGFARLMDLNTTTRRYTLNDEVLISVFDVHHIRVVDVNDEWDLYEKSSDVRYRGAILDTQGKPLHRLDYRGDYLSTPCVYSNGKNLIMNAIAHFKNPEVQTRVIDLLSTSNDGV